MGAVTGQWQAQQTGTIDAAQHGLSVGQRDEFVLLAMDQ